MSLAHEFSGVIVVLKISDILISMIAQTIINVVYCSTHMFVEEWV
jgi:hypothetical protein